VERRQLRLATIGVYVRFGLQEPQNQLGKKS
jgi:hypothetical protein